MYPGWIFLYIIASLMVFLKIIIINSTLMYIIIIILFLSEHNIYLLLKEFFDVLVKNPKKNQKYTVIRLSVKSDLKEATEELIRCSKMVPW